MLNYELFSQMKPTGYFINTGRGPTHNEADLIRALSEGKLAGAGLDVMEQEPTAPDNPLHTMENVVLTPHTASVSDIGNVERRRRVGQEIAAVLQGQMPLSVVNREVLNVVDAGRELPAESQPARALSSGRACLRTAEGYGDRSRHAGAGPC